MDVVAHIAPVDAPATMKSFISSVKPMGLILAENELWPGYLFDVAYFDETACSPCLWALPSRGSGNGLCRHWLCEHANGFGLVALL